MRAGWRVEALPEPVNFIKPEPNTELYYFEGVIQSGDRVEVSAVLGPSWREGIDAELVA
ncbi:MAG: hypothetical protein AAGN82_23885 [Myxococcota bacterium]